MKKSILSALLAAIFILAGQPVFAEGWLRSAGKVSLQYPADFVGIGVSNPDRRLVVSGDSSFEGNSLFSIGSLNSYVIHSADLDYDLFKVDGDSRFISMYDRVGIGTASPREALEVAGVIYSSNGGLKFPDGSIQTKAATTTTSLPASSITPGTFSNLGAYTFNHLDVFSPPISGYSAANKYYVDYQCGGGVSSGSTGMTLRNDGTRWVADNLITSINNNVGINTATPLYKLDVNGDVRANSYRSSDGSAGITATLNVRRADNSSPCYITIKNGLITGSNCQ